MFEPQFALRAAGAAAFCLLSTLPHARGAIVYSIPGSAYFQDFDSLPNSPENTSLGTTANQVGWTDDNVAPPVGQFSIPGWYLFHPLLLPEGGVNGNQRVRIGAGTANVGAFMSFGVSGSAERALGNVGSNTLANANADIYIGLRLHNDTGETLDSFTLSYNGEQWRDGGAAAPVAQTMTFMWSTTALTINDPNSSFTTVDELAFTSPIFANTGTGAAVDGNGIGRLSLGPVTVSGINWAPGTDLWLRWDDINNPGNDHGLAIDDLNFAAFPIPEPSTAVASAVGLMALITRRRRER